MHARIRPTSGAPSLQLQACTPVIGAKHHSAYTTWGFVGYLAAVALAVALSVSWHLSLRARLIGLLVPPAAFVITVAVVQLRLGRARIVFYQGAGAAMLAVLLTATALRAPVVRLLDLTVLGIGTFLVFGRLGCHAVACCHGRPARHGVVYGTAHVQAGLWERWQGRPLWPVQLAESAASLSLVVVALAVPGPSGQAAAIYASGYALVRFFLELVRGDHDRAFTLGLSEAQWSSAAAAALAAALWPRLWTGAAAAIVAVAALVLILSRHGRELLVPGQLRELHERCSTLGEAQATRTNLGVDITRHRLADGRTHWVLSSQHPGWTAKLRRTLAQRLWPEATVREGKSAGVMHVIWR